jgi:hypothetical protein
MYWDHRPKYTWLGGIFRKGMVHPLAAKKLNDIILENILNDLLLLYNQYLGTD